MPKRIILGAVIFIVVGFIIGYVTNEPEKQTSCKSAYDNLVTDDLCEGKFEEYWGSNEIIGNVEYFDFNWEELGTGIVKDEILGVNRQCYDQAFGNFVQSGERENLISCFTNSIKIVNNSLNIQCGCLFG